jgi:epoxyqueuosine reductase
MYKMCRGRRGQRLPLRRGRGETVLSDSEFTDTVVEKAKSLGASVAGVADVEHLKQSPSHRIYPKIGMDPEVPWQDAPEEAPHHEVDWPADAVSAVVIGVEHPVDQPELDWYDGKGTPGNRILIRITKELSAWLEETFSVKSHRPPYFIKSTGIFLKDSAVMAGLGRIGKNNLVITPGYGPLIRWRALLLDRTVKVTGPLDYDPCDGCPQPCRKACPVRAFDHTVYSSAELGQSILPGINGTYDRVTCNTKMSRDVEEAARLMAASDEESEALASTMNAFEEAVLAMPKGDGEPQYGVKYCRMCELSCPVGRRSHG